MSDAYLWDKSGPPDAEVARLESALAGARWKPAPLRLPAARPPSLWAALPAAAAALIGAAWVFQQGPAPTTGPGWRVEGVAGLTAATAGTRLVAGRDGASLHVGEIGEVTLEPGTRVRVDDTGREGHRLFLEEGALAARIVAAPRVFQVGTPAGLTVDLGCAYRIAVDRAGDTHCGVTSGRVAFETEGRRVVVPAGASCVAVPGRGPSSPVWDDAPPAVRDGAATLEFHPAPAGEAVARLVLAARPADALTLWHLLAAASPALRGEAGRRLAELAPPPEGVTLAGVLAGDEAMRAQWWDDLAARW